MSMCREEFNVFVVVASLASNFSWVNVLRNGGRQLLMDDDILDGQQPGKNEEGGELGGEPSQKRRREEGKKEGRKEGGGSFIFFFVKLLRALKYDVVGGDFSRVSHVVAWTAFAAAAVAFLRAGLSTVARPTTTTALTNRLIHLTRAGQSQPPAGTAAPMHDN